MTISESNANQHHMNKLVKRSPKRTTRLHTATRIINQWGEDIANGGPVATPSEFADLVMLAAAIVKVVDPTAAEHNKTVTEYAVIVGNQLQR